MEPNSAAPTIRSFYRALTEAWGPQHWWPANTRFEVVVGAYLTQNTAWTNVERAMANLRASRALTVDAIRHMPIEQLEALVRPAGYFRQKAQRLKNFIAFLDGRYNGSLARMFARPTAELRLELLALNGVGPETADSILLYGGNHPVFVVDAYTRRIVERHQLLPHGADYEAVRALFESALRDYPGPAGQTSHSRTTQNCDSRGAEHEPSRMSTARRTLLAQTYNEMHALIVGVGKRFCLKAEAKCKGCPLERFLLPGCPPASQPVRPKARRTQLKSGQTV